MQSDDLERKLGEQVRALRIAKRLTQRELSEQANVSIGALKHLESGSGSSVSTLVKVLRALGEDGWIATLGPGPAPFNPLEVLEARQRHGSTAPPRRVRHRGGTAS
jgi:transcriptional regulator with XRE-family HTH domain